MMKSIHELFKLKFKKHSWSVEIDPSIKGHDGLLFENLWRPINFCPIVFYTCTSIKSRL